MQLMPIIILFAINFHKFTNGLSNDIVGSLRCKLLCKEGDGYASNLGEDGICKCHIVKTLTDEQLLNIQDLSSYYNLPVLFRHDHQKNKKSKRDLDNSLLEDIRSKWDEHQQQWIQHAENLKSQLEQQHKNIEPLLGAAAPINDQAEQLKKWHEDHFGNVATMIENKKEEWEDTMEKLKDDTNDHLENLKAIHEDLVNGGLEEHLDNLKVMHEEMLGDIPAKLEENKQELEKQLKSWQEKHLEQAEPILGQMAPSLTTYDSKATGIGGSNVNFPPPDHPNPFVPPLAHIIRSFPFPRFNVDIAGRTPLAAPAPALGAPGALRFTHPLAPMHMNPLFRSRSAAHTLPEKLHAPYNPANPIVVQPVFMPQIADPTPKPILASLKNSVDEMLQNMKKHHGRLVPENYLNSDALSNSESQVNQINVNVRFEPTPTPANLFSFFLPGNRNWLAAPAPKNVDNDDRPVTEDPGMSESQENEEPAENKTNQRSELESDEEEEEDFEEEQRMRQKLTDANKSKSEPHVVDSVKKNLKEDKSGFDGNSLNGKYNSRGIIVQPKQFLQDSEEDLETLAK